MSDAICPRCGDDNITDYPVCDGCATVAHFTHRKICLHCIRQHDARTVAAARMQRIQIAADRASALLNELVAAGIDDPRNDATGELRALRGALARVRLHSLATRAAALLATIEGGDE